MSVRPVCCEPDPVLRRAAEPVERFSGALRRLVKDMVETMHANEGIGIAAPQIGESLQLFVASPTRRKGDEIVIANPALESRAGRVSVMEGCLSLPDIWGKVPRASRVRLRGRDAWGRPVDIAADGLLAVIFQHEVDHLEGKLFVDRLSWLQRRRLAGRLRALGCA